MQLSPQSAWRLEAALARPMPRPRAPWLWQACLGCCLALSGVLGAAPGVAQEVYNEEQLINREYPLKALFLYNFGSYVEWPAAAFPSADHPFVIGLLGV